MSTSMRLLFLLPIISTASLLALATHEGGHVVAGRLAGLRLLLFTSGPFQVERRADGRLHLGWVRSVVAAAGMAAMMLPDFGDRQRRRRALFGFALGGPVASLLLGAAAAVAFFALELDSMTWAQDGALKALAAGVVTYAATSLGLGAVTMVPNHFGGLMSDGARVQMLRREGPVADRHAAVFAASGWLMAGRKPRDWDPAVLAALLAPGDDGTFDAGYARYLAFLHALDRGDTAMAATHAGVMASADAPATLQPLLRAEAAYFAAAYAGDAATAQARLAEVRDSPLLDALTRRRAETAILLAGNDAAGAEALRALAVAVVADPHGGAAHDELRRLAERWGVSLAPSSGAGHAGPPS